MEVENAQNSVVHAPAEINPNLNILLLTASDATDIINSCLNLKFKVFHEKTHASARTKFQSVQSPIIISALGSKQDNSDHWEPLITSVRKQDVTCFIIIFSQTASDNPLIRSNLFDAGVNMVTNCCKSLENVLLKIKTQILAAKKSKLTCPICGMKDFTEDTLWTHLPLYHINLSNKKIKQIKSCPLCNKAPSPNLQVHYRNKHGPCGRGEMHAEGDEPATVYVFALVVVKRKEDGRYLLVQEFAQSGFWLPGGRVDRNENLEEAAIRETEEEAGVDIVLKGVLTVQFNHPNGRMRVIYYAEPKDPSQKPKSIPDYESAGASWVRPEEIEKIPLRGMEPVTWISYIEKGNPIFPLSVFSKE